MNSRVVDPERAKSIIGKTAQLELLEVVDTAFSKEELLKNTLMVFLKERRYLKVLRNI